MSDLENLPDFDNMSPEEMQRWLESLAKKQGATEGLITAADMEIADIDPNSVVIDEPGYVPSESYTSSSVKSTAEKPAAKPAKADAPTAAESAPEPVAAAAPPASAPEPEEETEVEIPPAPPRAAPSSAPLVQPPTPAAPSVPTPSTTPRGTGDRVRLPTEPPPPRQKEPAPPPPPAPIEQPAAELTPPPAPEPAGVGGLAWLESLAATQGDGGFEIDLSDFSAESAPAAPIAAPEAVNPENWLASLANAGGELETPFAADTTPKAAFVEESSSFMETLTRGGISGDDTTLPEIADEGATDPAAWLRSLSSSEGYDEEGVSVVRGQTLDQLEDRTPPASSPAPSLEGVEMDDETRDEIMRAISQGNVSPEQIELLFNTEMDRMAQEPEVELGDEDFFDPDAEPVRAELPDWLLDAVGGAPPTDAPVESDVQRPALIDLFPEDDASPAPAPVAAGDADMPDWLSEDPNAESMDFNSIFANDEKEDSEVLILAQQESVDTGSSDFTIEVDPNDTWAEAFDLEQDQGLGDITTEPEWYERNLRDPHRIAAVERLEQEQSTQRDALIEAALPAEDQLTPGQRVNMPDWLSDVAPQPQEAVTDMPDWLRETEAAAGAQQEAISDDMPDWLVEVVGDYEEPVADIVTPAAPPPVVIEQPRPVVKQTPASTPPPTQKPAAPITGDAAVALQQARDASQNDIAAGLSVYEGLIRANAAIDEVVNDLQSLVRQHRNNPAVYRVLGDGLMRQGKLQQALDTYREALNQL